MDFMVETQDLAKTYPGKDGTAVEAVKGIDLQIRKGEIFSLLGQNGAGKTTTISMISGLLEPTRGDVDEPGVDTDADLDPWIHAGSVPCGIKHSEAASSATSAWSPPANLGANNPMS